MNLWDFLCSGGMFSLHFIKYKAILTYIFSPFLLEISAGRGECKLSLHFSILCTADLCLWLICCTLFSTDGKCKVTHLAPSRISDDSDICFLPFFSKSLKPPVSASSPSTFWNFFIWLLFLGCMSTVLINVFAYIFHFASGRTIFQCCNVSVLHLLYLLCLLSH